MLHVEVFPAGAGHGAEEGLGAAGQGREAAEDRRLLRAELSLQGEGWWWAAGGGRCAHTGSAEREREDGGRDGGSDAQSREEGRGTQQGREKEKGS